MKYRNFCTGLVKLVLMGSLVSMNLQFLKYIIEFVFAVNTIEFAFAVKFNTIGVHFLIIFRVTSKKVPLKMA